MSAFFRVDYLWVLKEDAAHEYRPVGYPDHDALEAPSSRSAGRAPGSHW